MFSYWFTAKSATTVFKNHKKEVEDLCHQIADEVVDLTTIHFQTEKATNAVSSQLERRTSLVEASLGRNWHTGSFTGSFSGVSKSQKDFSDFTLSFMEKLQHKVKSNEKRQEQSAVDTKELHQSLQKSLRITESDTEAKKQMFDEEVEETMRQLLNPVAGDADDLASQIVDRISNDILGLLNIKLTSSMSLPISTTDPLESARAIILEVLLNAMSLDDDESPDNRAENSTSPSGKKEPTSPLAKTKLPKFTPRQESAERPAGTSLDAVGSASVISAQLLFSQLTTTIAHAVIEKLNKETTTRSPLTSVASESEDGPPLPFLTKPDDNGHDASTIGDDDPGATRTPTINNTDEEYDTSKNGK